jgi:hypothetical protein
MVGDFGVDVIITDSKMLRRTVTTGMPNLTGLTLPAKFSTLAAENSCALVAQLDRSTAF